MSWRNNKLIPLAVLAGAVVWWSCDDGRDTAVAPQPEVEAVTPQFTVLPSGGGSGAIFTTTPDGGIVNENVHYEGRQEVYLDGGPPPNAPAKAAGLDEGFYVFQITDPPGKKLLSRDPARCRIVHVNAAGVIDELMAPTDDSRTDPDGNTVVFYTGATTDNWEDGRNGFNEEPCHVQEGPDGTAGTYAPTPDITGVGRHDTNTDLDHGDDAGAIVAQMMPYGLTPNPGGVYKAWMTPIQAYVNEKGADLNDVPTQLPRGKQKPHPCGDFCAAADPGFVPSHRYTKTDNFKVTERFPAEIKVRKFHDLDGDGKWDDGEPEIGVDQFVLETGAIDPAGGGWPYDWTEPLDGGTKTTKKYTPGFHIAGFDGTYTAEEYHLDGWIQTAAYLDGDPSTGEGFVYDGSGPAKAVSVSVSTAVPGVVHEIVFGNFQPVDVTACKFEDMDGDGGKDAVIEGWEVYLTIDDEIVDTQATGADGCYTWTDLGPLPAGSYYDVKEETPDGWTPTGAYDNDGVFHAGWTEVDFESPPQSGASYKGEFTNFENVEVTACKYEDMDGDGGKDAAIEGWEVYLTIDDAIVDTQVTGENGCYTWTDLGPLPNGSYYDVAEETPEGWTPTSPTQVDFESPPQSGASYRGDFTNFKNVDVTACKVKDADGLASTTGDRTPKGGWPVYLTKNGVVQDTKNTDDVTGCYTWTDLPPLPAGEYYDVGEEAQEGWIALGPTYHEFESPPQSGASYTFTFVNTPTQGCTPGFWQGGSDGGQAGGQWLWNEVNDPTWGLSGGEGTNPFIWTTLFNDFFTAHANLDGLTMMDLVNTGGTSDDVRKAARSLVAAYLNASWGVAYAYTTAELVGKWNDAVATGEFLALHIDLDGANNAPGGCPIDASGY
jgi:hypothetical protein